MNRADSPGFWRVGDESKTYTEDCEKQLKQFLWSAIINIPILTGIF